jgi:hypothetical protein
MVLQADLVGYKQQLVVALTVSQGGMVQQQQVLGEGGKLQEDQLTSAQARGWLSIVTLVSTVMPCASTWVVISSQLQAHDGTLLIVAGR